MGQSVTLAHEIGSEVSPRHAPDCKATVTAACIRQGGYTNYELTWMHNGEIKTAWLTTDDITKAEEKKTVGFKT